jgi:hypothetical protein
MSLKQVYHIHTQELEWYIDGHYLSAVEVQPYFDKRYGIDHEVKQYRFSNNTPED